MPSAPNAADVAQADDLLSKAEKKLKTSVFRWKPSYLEAAELYDRAAKLYASAMMRGNACDAWKKAAAAYRKAHENNFAASSLENLAAFLISKYSAELVSPEAGETSGTLTEAVLAFQEAAMLARAERPARAIDLMHRAVDVMERVLNEDPANKMPAVGSTASLEAIVPPNPLYKEFVRVVYNTLAMYHLFADRDEILPHRVTALCRACVIRHLRCGEYHLAIAIEKHLLGCLVVRSNLSSDDPQRMYEKPPKPSSGDGGGGDVFEEELNVFKRLHQPSNAARAGLEIIILTLYANNRQVEEANREFQALCKVYGFKDSQEQRSVSLLLSAMEDHNESQISEVLASDQCFIFILGQISRMAMNFAKATNKDSGAAGEIPVVRDSPTGVRLSVSTAYGGAAAAAGPRTPIHADPNHLSVPDDAAVTPPPQSYSSPSESPAVIAPLPSSVMISIGGMDLPSRPNTAGTAESQKVGEEAVVQESPVVGEFHFPFMSSPGLVGVGADKQSDAGQLVREEEPEEKQQHVENDDSALNAIL